MKGDNVAKRVFERNPEGRRRRGRPKLRWKDSVLEDYQKFGVGIAWRTAAYENAENCGSKIFLARSSSSLF